MKQARERAFAAVTFDVAVESKQGDELPVHVIVTFGDGEQLALAVSMATAAALSNNLMLAMIRLEPYPLRELPVKGRVM